MKILRHYGSLGISHSQFSAPFSQQNGAYSSGKPFQHNGGLGVVVVVVVAIERKYKLCYCPSKALSIGLYLFLREGMVVGTGSRMGTMVRRRKHTGTGWSTTCLRTIYFRLSFFISLNQPYCSQLGTGCCCYCTEAWSSTGSFRCPSSATAMGTVPYRFRPRLLLGPRR